MSCSICEIHPEGAFASAGEALELEKMLTGHPVLIAIPTQVRITQIRRIQICVRKIQSQQVLASQYRIWGYVVLRFQTNILIPNPATPSVGLSE